MNPVLAIRPSRRFSKMELFDGGLRVMLTDGVEIRITYEDGRITLVDDQYFSSRDQFHDADMQAAPMKDVA